jgi:hypothetical protein
MINGSHLLTMTSNDKGLKWLPWIGKNYFKLPSNKRLFVVGERHYRGDVPQLIDYSINRNYIKWMIEDTMEGNDWYRKEFSSLTKSILGEDNIDYKEFWEQVGFHHFIQKSLETADETPSEMDFEAGWRIFFDLIGKVNPGVCIFAGEQAADFLESAINKVSGLRLTAFGKDGYPVDGVIPKYAEIKPEEGGPCQLIFIKQYDKITHPEAWNAYLTQKIGKIITPLQDKRVLNSY